MRQTLDGLADFDEFSMLKVYADHEGIPWRGRPEVFRRSYKVTPEQRLSVLVWGQGPPEIVLLHGGGQNAHTWDSVAIALDRPLIAIDLPGHGHSDWRDDRDYSPAANAQAVAHVIEQAAPHAAAVVGMSLGGLTNIHLASNWPKLVRRVVIVDIAPAAGQRTKSMTKEQRGATSLVSGPAVFDSLDEMLQSVVDAVPGRSIESLRLGVLHNAKQLKDGRWAWRYDRLRLKGTSETDSAALWNDFASISAPIFLIRGSSSVFVRDDDEVKMQVLQPSLWVEHIEGAGHSVQSDRPVALAESISDFIASTG